MFDVSFTELMLIGVIALIVIGPERLPKVARTIGHLLGRAQRYVNEVKTDIQKEIDIKEIGDIKHQMEDAARSVQSSMSSSVDDLKAAVTQPTQALKDSLAEARQALDISAVAPGSDSTAPVADSNAAEKPAANPIPGTPATPDSAATAAPAITVPDVTQPVRQPTPTESSH
ncbi:Sec-independent protein translocase protein TatB [Castellaniella sp.]|uniref:Sec-independent protein translocase protein TatB n=1 Tax=Castellaniella sp. TaxID=1955812 RepID=UPI002AFED2F2|nr:Sec-independent protein translocase protein TatB [Castellaniella sp.]